MTINRRSITLMSSSSDQMHLTSTAAKADSYYGYTDGLQTIQVIYSNFEGRVRIQATLSLEPTENDWFNLVPITIAGTAFHPNGYVEFGEGEDEVANGSEAYTVQGNFAFLRVVMDRAEVGDGETYDASYGQIMQVLMST